MDNKNNVNSSLNQSIQEDFYDKPSVFYDLNMLSIKRPGPVLAVGYGNPLRAVVRSAEDSNVHPLYTTGTDDKARAFAFSGSATVVSIGKKFDERLFSNDFAILQAAKECNARTILCASNIHPSQLLIQECARDNILLLTPWSGDKSLKLWEKPDCDADINDLEEIDWRKCAHCGFTHDNNQVIRNDFKCPTCGKLVRLTSEERMALTFDENSVEEWDTEVDETNALDFPEFDSVIDRARTRSGYEEGVRTGQAKIEGIPVAFGIMEPSFMMGSMGHVVGEKLARMFERATEKHLPVIVFSTSGGARMQEGLSSLMQMAKVSAAVRAHSDAGLLYISVLCDPTTGGVTASFATLGDIMIAEPGAIIGFAGRRVIQDTIKQALPDDFQSAEFALSHGLIDMIVERDKLRSVLGQILSMHSPENGKKSKAVISVEDTITEKLESNQKETSGTSSDSDNKVVLEGKNDAFSVIAKGLAGFAQNLGQAVTEQTNKASLWWAIRNKGVADYPYIKQSVDKGEDSNLAWQSVQLARNVKRPTAKFYIDVLVDDFVEFHGDRMFSDDGAIIAGIGEIGGRPVTVIGIEKGSDLKDKIARNFGCPQPEGYRKAMRLMSQAEKFGRPIICLVDTQGAYCGKEAEERGMGGAIAESLAFMSQLNVPVISVVIGEGGSGGALALAVANKVAMQENAIYSVLSPEGFASILWKDGTRAPEAAEVMKLSAPDALSMNMIEDIIPEGNAPAHENPDQAAAALWLYITNALDELCELDSEALKEQRYERFRKF